MTPPILTANGLRKAYGPRVLLQDVDLAIGARERVGLVGDNGTGKSTLAKILAGLEATDAGDIATQRDAHVAYLSQRPTLDEGATAREVVLGGMGEWRDAMRRYEEASAALESATDLSVFLDKQSAAGADVERLGGWGREREVEATLHHLGIDEFDAPVGRMSGGERRRVDLARLLVSAPDLAILDEPTNHLDIETIEWLEKYLRDSFGGALLLVTHDRYVLERVAERTLELDHGQLYSYKGGWSAYLEAKSQRLEIEARTEANRQNFLRTEVEWLRRSPSARSTKQKARISRAHDAIDTAAPVNRAETRLELETERLGGTILELHDISVTLGGTTLIDGLTVRMQRGDRIGVLGKSGCGKTSLLRVVLGELAPTSGSVVLGKNTRIAYFDQARSGLDDAASIQENVAGLATKVDMAGRTMDIRSYMSRFLFDGKTLQQKVGALSGGERARVALAKLLLQPANLLIFDEPTNDLDVATLSSLEGLLVEADRTALVVSHDRYFLDRVANSILAFEGEGQVTRYVGDYDDYTRLRSARAVEERASARPPGVSKARPKTGLSTKEKRELETILEDIDAAERRAEALDVELADPALYELGGDRVAQCVAKREAAHAQLERLMTRWETLEAKKTIS